ncbi:MAG: 4Fe-4S binding protein, partial [Erysipelotrichaceae bacterium]|nr:4Fe-4S binding protein [Erysipelotrichaceae bacterium]
VGALTVEDVAVCDPDVCIDCGACVATCPVEAISQ